MAGVAARIGTTPGEPLRVDGGVPELKVDHAWDSNAKLAKITVRQTQKLSEQVRLFRVPLPVTLTVTGQKEPLRFTMDVSKEVEDFHFTLPAQPELVRIDPDFTVLAKISFTPPGPMRLSNHR